MLMSPYLIFKGQCKEAFAFYQKALGGEITAMMTARGSPMEQHCPPDQLDNVMHARLKVGEPKTIADAERLYAALSEGGKIEMEMQPTFWTVRFAIFKDRYGTPWMISCEQAPAQA